MLQMPAVFSNHMVLQREKTLRFFGETDAAQVSISFLEQRYEIQVRDGKWMAELPPQPAAGPFCVKICAGQDTLEFQDVYFGEVWLAGGQSNMEFEIRKSLGGEKLLEEAKKAAASRDTEYMQQVRFYQVSRISYLGEELEKAEKENCWQCYGDAKMDDWSAVGFYFAEKIAKELKVMVGIIGCNWGGTSASCWMSRGQLLSGENTKDYVREYEEATEGQIEEEYLKELAEYKAYQSVFDKNVGEYYQTAENPTWEEAISLFGENRYPGPMGPRNERRPAGLYETMLCRVQPYQLRGFLFYQAEEDDHRPYTYGELLELLIGQWRTDWQDEQMPFYYVLLPMFADVGAEDFKNWPFLREAQIKVNQKIKHTGMASAFDLGEYGNIHPLRKEPVGDRLANIALCRVYGKASFRKQCETYRFRDFAVCGREMKLRFRKTCAGFQSDRKDTKADIHYDTAWADAGPSTDGSAACADAGLATDGSAACADAGLATGAFAACADAGAVTGAFAAKENKHPAQSGSAVTVLTEAVTLHLYASGETEEKRTEYTPEDSLPDFEIAGEDGRFVPAKAQLSEDRTEIILSTEEIAYPQYARYLWTNYKEVKIFGENGLPMEPFRTCSADGSKATGSRQGYVVEKDFTRTENKN